ncbi:unnamed protein product [Bursaphelenchus okinawaensis]|uniref:Uncharacterized protein n=1 Tax=Bursaphelenchus okinawaensis TaxID=465554 RepID=A0A811KRM9_9BILA|nr:unnamed protein product [Bursaphelenchus okinawaensis]CAG9110172.1 unnamed protein product [Bursaphelenchus okinawaensis]
MVEFDELVERGKELGKDGVNLGRDNLLGTTAADQSFTDVLIDNWYFVAGGVAVLVLILVLSVCCCCAAKKKNQQQ